MSSANAKVYSIKHTTREWHKTVFLGAARLPLKPFNKFKILGELPNFSGSLITHTNKFYSEVP
jgi:hypothetical protein